MVTFLYVMAVIYVTLAIMLVLDLLRLWPPSPRFYWRKNKDN